MNPSQKDLYEAIKRLTDSIDRVGSRIDTWGKIFVAGVIKGLGAAVGATIVFAIVGFILNILEIIPGIGDLAHNLNQILEINK